MSILSPQDDAAALKPLIDQAVQEALQGLSSQVAPALGQAVQSALDGLVITVTIGKKNASS